MKGRLRNILYLLSLTPAVTVVFGNLYGGYFTLLNLIYSLGILGVSEWILPVSKSNQHTPKSDVWPALILYLHLPAQLLALASLCVGVAQNVITGPWIVCAVLSTGLNSGSSAIVVAHELIHRKRKIEQGMGKILLFMAGNTYFYVEHLRVHHKWVGTAKDHVTARFGESLYKFFIRSVYSQFISAFRIESERCKRDGTLSAWLGHYVVVNLFLHTLLLILLFVFFNITGVMVWLGQCVIANFLLEYVNYIEHYGLKRSENERVQAQHSWDSDQFASRFVLVDLSRHADHHAHAAKPYHTLSYSPASNKLPSGYSGMFFIAAIPPLWRSIIHKRMLHS